jgi:hypothetical protein
MSEFKHGLLFGNNYPGHEAKQVIGCSKAPIRMADCLVKHLNFKRENVQLKLDIDPMLNKERDHMEDIMINFVTGRKEGEILLIYLSGHGSLGHSLLTEEKFRVENSFVTLYNDLIRDDVSLTLVCDFCFSGGILGGLKRIFKDPPPAKIEFQYTNNGRPSSDTI